MARSPYDKPPIQSVHCDGHPREVRVRDIVRLVAEGRISLDDMIVTRGGDPWRKFGWVKPGNGIMILQTNEETQREEAGK